jgi:hypothetical protein
VLRKVRRRPTGSGPVRVARYKERYFAVYDRLGLVAVTVYRKGALSLAKRLAPTSRPAKKRRHTSWR